MWQNVQRAHFYSVNPFLLSHPLNKLGHGFRTLNVHVTAVAYLKHTNKEVGHLHQVLIVFEWY